MGKLLTLNQRAINHSINTLKSKVFKRIELKNIDEKYRFKGAENHYERFAINNRLSSWEDYWKYCRSEAVEIFDLIDDLCNPHLPGFDPNISIQANNIKSELTSIVNRIDQNISDLKFGAAIFPIINLQNSVKQDLIDNLPLSKLTRSLFKDALDLMNIKVIKNKKQKTTQIEMIIPYSRLFINKIIGNELVKILKTKRYLDDNGIWIGITGERVEFLRLVKRLNETELFKIGQLSKKLRSFGKEFSFDIRKSDLAHARQDLCSKKGKDDIESVVKQITAFARRTK